MKKLAIVLLIMLGFTSLAWGGRRVRQVEVVNDPLNVNVVNQSQPVQYEYLVFAISGGVGETQTFQANLNSLAADGWEFVSFSWQDVPTPSWVGIMKRPVVE